MSAPQAPDAAGADAHAARPPRSLHGVPGWFHNTDLILSTSSSTGSAASNTGATCWRWARTSGPPAAVRGLVRVRGRARE